MNLKEYISKKENNALELVKCGGCQNALIHCGKYEIVKSGKVEGILCETCKHSERKLRIATTVSDDGKSVFQNTVQELLLEKEKEEGEGNNAISTKKETNDKKEEKKVSK